MEYILETERLTVRELQYDDSSFIIQLLNCPGWLQYIGDRNVRTTEDAIRYIDEGPRKSYREKGFGLYVVETKNNRISIGICGLLKRDAIRHPDIGFAFLPEFEGHGYALEVAQAIMRYAKDYLKITNVCAITKADNVRSIRLLEKLGFVYVRQIRLPSTNEELLLYSTDQFTS